MFLENDIDYSEDADNAIGTRPPTGRHGWCTARSGGTSLSFEYGHSGQNTPHSISQRIAEPGRIPIRLGESRGYTSDREAGLFFSGCYGDTGRLKLLTLKVSLNNPDPVKSDDAKKLLAQLVADQARYVATELECPTADTIPPGPPTIG
ncbi:hypothetical protein ACFWRV_10735 [Streptomyces sp. NPDC058576]|uniref:hypothetical protein n=1 Tax=Streptomyces sp. NPDC058576 TaxID=3346547 RepID=UPI00365D86CB